MQLSDRRPGPDVVRALAMFGVLVMNYHGYMILRGAPREGGWAYDLFDPWTGPLSTRFAATFVLTAGVGVTLMCRSSIGDAERTTDMRWRLIRRGFVLYAFGVLFDYIWRGTILPYYGVMFIIAAALFTLRSRWVLAVGAVAALSGWLVNWWTYERNLDGHDTSWLTDPGSRSPRALAFDMFVNGTHPVLPWLAFLCAGIVLGRIVINPAWNASWRPLVAGIGFALYAVASLVASSVTTPRMLVVLGDDPFTRSIVYVASALGTALLAYVGISWIADRFSSTTIVDVLRRAGQLSLTIYIAHALLFNLLVDRLDVVQPGTLATPLVFALVYWVIAIAMAVAYQRRHGRGPAERLYRHLTA